MRGNLTARAILFSVPRGTRAPSLDATHNEGPYLRPSSQGSWMEEMRAHRKCAAIVLHARTRRPESIQKSERKPMQIKKLTPNLIVRNVEASLKFYREVLGLETAITVPDQSPYVFASASNGTVEIFFNTL